MVRFPTSARSPHLRVVPAPKGLIAKTRHRHQVPWPPEGHHTPPQVTASSTGKTHPSAWATVSKAFKKTFADLIGTAKSHPALFWGTASATVALGIVAPVITALVGLGILGWGIGQTLLAAWHASTDKTDAEREESLERLGDGLAKVAMAAPSVFAVPTTVRAAQTAAQATTWVEGVMAALRTGGLLEESPGAVEAVQMALSHGAIGATETPETLTVTRAVAGRIGAHLHHSQATALAA